MRILILQQSPGIDAGFLKGFLDEEGHEWTQVDPGGDMQGVSKEGYDALWAIGGGAVMPSAPAGAAADLVRELVAENGLPYLGIVFGHHLLAMALGGEVGPSRAPDAGVADVQLTEAGATGVLFDDFPEVFPAFQCHEAEITRLPEGAQVLVTSPDTAVQAMRWGTRAHSLQFHLDADAAGKTLAAQGIEASPDERARLLADCERHRETFVRLAERLLINWMQTAARTR